MDEKKENEYKATMIRSGGRNTVCKDFYSLSDALTFTLKASRHPYNKDVVYYVFFYPVGNTLVFAVMNGEMMKI